MWKNRNFSECLPITFPSTLQALTQKVERSGHGITICATQKCTKRQKTFAQKNPQQEKKIVQNNIHSLRPQQARFARKTSSEIKATKKKPDQQVNVQKKGQDRRRIPKSLWDYHFDLGMDTITTCTFLCPAHPWKHY
jgi:hypothetical protein